MNELSIVMYHYVRPIIESKFPGIKGLEFIGFKRQLDYLNEHFNIVSTEQVVNACMKGAKLPLNACWLTFDDGYKDHYEFVLPELVNRNLHGAFFPPRVAIEENVLLDVNSIHHILSCVTDLNDLVYNLNECCRIAGISENKISSFHEEFAVANKFDNANTIYVKRMLQYALPEELRNEITKKLFKDFVGISAEEFSQELYMSVDEIRKLIDNGMYVGSHGSMHYWLDKISAAEQENDIKRSLEFLEHVGSNTINWVMCYPYGAYNDETLSILGNYQASVGITTKNRIANLKTDNPFKLPRLNTNDFPQ
jgi:peptidoglycan/xylan/chitin deacetylase (PgdA/CDA1 family)